MDKLTETLHDIAIEHGIAKLAADMGVSRHVLSNQLNPLNDRPISLAKFYQMVRLTQDVRCVQPLLEELGMRAVKTEKPSDDLSLFDVLINQQSSFGSVAGEIKQALADGKIDTQEAAQIRRAINEASASLYDLDHAMQEMAQPRAVR